MSIPFAIALCMVACSGDSSNASSAGDDETEIENDKDEAKSSFSEAKSSSSSEEEEESIVRHVFDDVDPKKIKEGCDHLDIDDKIWAYYTVFSDETFGERRLEHYVLVNDTTHVDSLCGRCGRFRCAPRNCPWSGEQIFIDSSTERERIIYYIIRKLTF